jgi:hypothetical protein
MRPVHLIDPENANRSGPANTRRIPLIVCAGEPYMTGLKCSGSAPWGNDADAMSASVATGIGQQAAVVHPGRQLSVEPS